MRKIGDFPHFLSALASNNQFIIKLVKMWPGGTPHVVVGTLVKKFKKRSLVECCSVSSCELCVMPAGESKLVSRSNRKATVAKTVLIG